MLDVKFIREYSKEVQQASKNKGIEVDINHVLEIDKKYRELLLSVQKLREERNKFTQELKGKPTDKGTDMVLKKHVGLIHCENKLR